MKPVSSCLKKLTTYLKNFIGMFVSHDGVNAYISTFPLGKSFSFACGCHQLYVSADTICTNDLPTYACNMPLAVTHAYAYTDLTNAKQDMFKEECVNSSDTRGSKVISSLHHSNSNTHKAVFTIKVFHLLKKMTDGI